MVFICSGFYSQCAERIFLENLGKQKRVFGPHTIIEGPKAELVKEKKATTLLFSKTLPFKTSQKKVYRFCTWSENMLLMHDFVFEQKLCEELIELLRDEDLSVFFHDSYYAHSYPYLFWLYRVSNSSIMNDTHLYSLLKSLLENPNDRCLLLNEIIDFLHVVACEEITEDLNELTEIMEGLVVEHLYLLHRTDVLSKKKRKKRRKRHHISPSYIFSTMANSCVQLGQVAALLGPEKQAMLNLFALGFSAIAQATRSRRDREKEDKEYDDQDDDEYDESEKPILGDMSQGELTTNVALLIQAINNLVEAKKSVDEKNSESKKTRSYGLQDTFKTITSVQGDVYVVHLMQRARMHVLENVDEIKDYVHEHIKQL